MVPALIAALGIVMLLFGWQSMRAEGLEGQVDGLTADLAVATEEIRAHEQRLGLVRTHVDDLAGRVATLQDLVAE